MMIIETEVDIAAPSTRCQTVSSGTKFSPTCKDWMA